MGLSTPKLPKLPKNATDEDRKFFFNLIKTECIKMRVRTGGIPPMPPLPETD